MKDYRTLEVWQLGIAMASECHRFTESFPNHEMYGLTSQIRRAAISIPSTIAEGVGRDTDRELLRFVRISIGSVNEIETQVLIATDLGLCSYESAPALEEKLRHLTIKLRNFAAKLQKDIESSPRQYVREDRAIYNEDEE